MKFGPQNVLPSRDVSNEVPVNKPAPPPSEGITNMTPIASRRMSGNATPDWPMPARTFSYYGSGPK